MTQIQITADMDLIDFTLAAYRAAPNGIDFTHTPDGIVTFTDEARPGEEFRFGPDPEFADSVSWGEWSLRWGDPDGPQGAQWDCSRDDGCELSDLQELASALGRWVDGLTEFGWLMDYATADEIRPATRDELLESLRAAKLDSGAGAFDLDGRTVYVVGAR